MRRATRLRQHHANVRQPISIHALHEESDTVNGYYATSTVISIHALHEESDPKRSNVFRPDPISIHALHEESDWTPKDGWVR